MEAAYAHGEEALEGIAFAGETLGPLFSYDPAGGEAAGLYAALASMDPDEAARDWPFGEPLALASALADVVRGLAGGVDDDVIWEYRRLFVGPGPKAAPPWGSVYTDRETVVFGESTLALRQWMRCAGVRRLGAEAEPEDHIGTMLQLMAWLARHRPDLLDEYLADHLLTWAPHFLGIMEEQARHPLYGGLAALTRLSLEGIQDERGLVVEEPRFYR